MNATSPQRLLLTKICFLLALGLPLMFSLDFGPMPKVNSQIVTVTFWSIWLFVMRRQGLNSIFTSPTVAFLVLIGICLVQLALGMFGYPMRVILSIWQLALAALITSLYFDPEANDRLDNGSILPMFGWTALIVMLWQVPITFLQNYHLEVWMLKLDEPYKRVMLLWLIAQLPLLYFLRGKNGLSKLQFALFWQLGLFIVYLVGKKWFDQTTLEWLLSPSEFGNAMGNVRQRNHVATMMTLGIVGLIFVYPQVSVRMRWLLVTLLTLPIAFTFSRTGFIQVLMLPLVWYFLLGRQALERKWWPILAVPLLFLTWSVLLTLIQQVFFPEMENMFGRLAQSGQSQRWHYWPQVFDVFLHYPWIGVGWGQLRVGMLDTNFNAPVIQYIDHAHNLVLQLLAETGLLGLLAVAVATCIWLRHIWLIRANGGYQRHPWAAAAIYGCFAYLNHSMLEFPLWYDYFLFPFCLLLALSVGVEKVPQEKQSNSPYLTYFVLLSVPLSIWVFVSYQAMHNMYQGLPKDSKAAIELLEKNRKNVFFPELGDFMYVAMMMPEDDLKRGVDLHQRYKLNEKVLTAFTDPRIVSQQLVLGCALGGTNQYVQLMRRAQYIRTAFPSNLEEAVDNLVAYLNGQDKGLDECLRQVLKTLAPGFTPPVAASTPALPEAAEQ